MVGQVPRVQPFLSQLSTDDGADCISDISWLYNPKAGKQTDRWKATAGELKEKQAD